MDSTMVNVPQLAGEVAGVKFGDERFTNRLVRVVEALGRRPHVTFLPLRPLGLNWKARIVSLPTKKSRRNGFCQRTLNALGDAVRSSQLPCWFRTQPKCISHS